MRSIISVEGLSRRFTYFEINNIIAWFWEQFDKVRDIGYVARLLPL